MKKVKYGILAFVMCATFACKNAEKDTTKEVSKDNSKEKSTTETTEKVAEKPAETPKSEKSSQNEQVFEGTFQGIEQGDYAYFKVKNAKEEKSFMVFNADETYDKISASPEKFVGKKVKVSWIATKEDVPEAGGKIDVEKYIKAEILN